MQDSDIKDYLPLVRKPSRYIGGEVNSIRKDLSRVRLAFGLGFPDAYEVGMSHLGIQILYQILNAREDIACERVFAPWEDMEGLLRSKGMRLSTLESGVALCDLDVMGFSLQYELSYTNVINMLDLGGIPIYSRDRGEKDPFVIGGGPVAFNAEPVADFFDAFLLGDGEDAVLDISDCIIEGRQRGEGRKAILKRLAGVRGVYVPSFFDVKYNSDGAIREIIPLVEGYGRVAKRTVPDINMVPLPTRPVVPFMETVHDRVSVEIARGCTRGCRFCQAGSIYRPVRERSPENIIKIISEALRNTGYEEVSLLSLSTGDYTFIEDLLTGLMSGFERDRVAVSLPSLRVGTLSARVANEIRKVRKTGFTLAPEAGSERLRRLINKGIKEEDLHETARDVFSLGWSSMKLYFMIGLPTETGDDIAEIARLASCVRGIGRKASGGRAPQVNVSASCFIPKPHTPFQWEPQISLEECAAKQADLKKRLSALGLGFKWHDPRMSVLEGVFSRGDRKLSAVLVNAFRKGCRFDGWSERFRYDLWEKAFEEAGLGMDFYTGRQRPFEEVFPWDHLNPGVTKEFLWREHKNSLDLAGTPDCKTDRCSKCGVCDFKTIRNVVAPDAGPIEGLVEAGARGPQASDALPCRLRLKFSKTGALRFLSHLELINAIVRGIRRAGLPLRYSQGFHPLPKVSFSAPLPVGLESLEEYMDMELDRSGARVEPAEALKRLNAAMPKGISFLECGVIPLKLRIPSAMMTEYMIPLMNGPAGLNIEPEKIEGFVRDCLAKDSIVIRIEKDGMVKEVDIRPQIAELSLAGDATLRMVLRSSPGASVRPHDVLSALLGLPRATSPLIPVLKTKTVH